MVDTKDEPVEKYEFLPESVKALVPKLGSNEDKPASEVKVPLKFFNPVGGATWWVTEADWTAGIMFGYVDLGPPFSDDAELGYINLEELIETKLRFGMKVERDIHWDPNTTLKQVMEKRGR